MRYLRRARPSPSMVVAFIALLVAMGGTGYAAAVLAPNSVGTQQLKKGAVKGRDIGKNAVTSRKVKNRSLLAVDFKAGQLPAGAQGAQGQQGPQGPPGQRGPSDAFQTAAAGPVALGAASTELLTFDLPSAGSYVLSSKVYINNDGAGDAFVNCTTAVGTSSDLASTGVQADSGEDDHRTIGGLLAATTTGPDTATFACQRFAGTTISANDMRMVAIRVGSLTE
jgi:hypothetical protein